MTLLTLDASVIVKWYIARPDEQDADQALALLDRLRHEDGYVIQPPHALAEIAAVLARELPRQAQAYFEEVVSIFSRFPVSAMPAVYARAIDLSQTLNHHLFDTLYHATALEHGATLLTADERYHAKAATLGGVRLLKDFAG